MTAAALPRYEAAMDAPPVVIPVQRRAYTVVSHLLAAMLLPWLGWIFGLVVGSPLVGGVAVGLILGALLWSVTRRWNSRVEVHADHIVHWDAGRSRVLPFDALARVDLRWFDARQAFLGGQEMTATFVPNDGEPVQVRGMYSAVRGAIDPVVEALATRVIGRLRAGETLVFADRPGFPTRAVLAFGFFALLAVVAVVMALANARRGSLRGVPQMAGMLLMTGIYLSRSMKTWLGARRNGGLAVSAQGVAPLTGYSPAEIAAGGYRTAAGAAAGWIPWGALGGIHEDGFSLSFTASTTDRPVVLSPATQDFVTLGRVLRREMAREQMPPSGVRVDLGAAPSTASAEEPADDDIAAKQRAR